MLSLLSDNSLKQDNIRNWIFPQDKNVSSAIYNEALAQEFNSDRPAVYLQNSSDWGPKRDPLSIVIPVTILYTLIFFSGVIGNVSTCVVIARNKTMHTATNYYLFSLAISDLLLLISGLPPEIYSIWSKYPYIFGEIFCVLQGFAAETSANATVLTITAFTMERYVAICHPFLSHTMSKLSRAIKFVIVIWVIAMCLAVPQAMAFGIVYDELPDGRLPDDDHYVCNVKRTVIPHAFEISTFLFFVAPMSLITVLYVLIGLQLRRSTVRPSRGGSVRLNHRVCKPAVTYTNTSTQAVLVVDENETEKLQLTYQEEDGRKNFSRNAQASKHVVKMLVAVVVAFFICWAPFHAQRLLAIYGQPSSTDMVTAFRILTYVSGVLYYLSTTVNPLLYHIMSNKFREAFKHTFGQCLRQRRRQTGNKCYSTLSGRSSQVNSHSNTDSCSRQNSLRYLEAEMARLHDSRRPLVVSFKRKNTEFPKSHKQVTILDAELQEALNRLQDQPRRPNKKIAHDFQEFQKSISSDTIDTDLNDCSFIEMHHLHSSHVCPKSKNRNDLAQIEEIEIFHEQRLRINTVKRGENDKVKGRANSVKSRLDVEEHVVKNLIKSRTMPQMTAQNINFEADKCTVIENKFKSCSPLKNFNRKEFFCRNGENIPIHVT